MIKNIIKIIAVASAVAFPAVHVQKANEPLKGYQIYEGQYVSEILVGDIMHDYIGKEGCWELVRLTDTETKKWVNVVNCITSAGIVEKALVDGYVTDLVDIEKSGLKYNTDEKRFLITKNNSVVYLKKPLKASAVTQKTEKYLSYTSPAQTFAAGYDGLIPSFYYTSISGNKSFFESITSVSSLVEGKLWQSGDVSPLNIKKDDLIFQYYYVVASVMEAQQMYDVWLRAYAKSEDGKKSEDVNIKELAFLDLNLNDRIVESYTFPYPVSTLETKSGYYNIIHSSGAYGITESIKNYEEGYKDGQGNPTFKSFIVSAFESCAAFFSLPVLGEHITIGTLIGSFVGLGALFLLIKLFR